MLVAEQGRLVTSLMRPAFAYPLAVYYAAVIADSLFHFRWETWRRCLLQSGTGADGSSRRYSSPRAASGSRGTIVARRTG
ncbi:MAG: hypothetical protein WDM84_07600 [Bauldia sp.]